MFIFTGLLRSPESRSTDKWELISLPLLITAVIILGTLFSGTYWNNLWATDPIIISGQMSRTHFYCLASLEILYGWNNTSFHCLLHRLKFSLGLYLASTHVMYYTIRCNNFGMINSKQKTTKWEKNNFLSIGVIQL